jgi:hypothetical protein
MTQLRWCQATKECIQILSETRDCPEHGRKGWTP